MNEKRLMKYGDLLLVRCELLLDKMEEEDRVIFIDLNQKMTDYDLDGVGSLEEIVNDIEEYEEDLSELYMDFQGVSKMLKNWKKFN